MSVFIVKIPYFIFQTVLYLLAILGEKLKPKLQRNNLIYEKASDVLRQASICSALDNESPRKVWGVQLFGFLFRDCRQGSEKGWEVKTVLVKNELVWKMPICNLLACWAHFVCHYLPEQFVSRANFLSYAMCTRQRNATKT